MTAGRRDATWAICTGTGTAGQRVPRAGPSPSTGVAAAKARTQGAGRRGPAAGPGQGPGRAAGRKERAYFFEAPARQLAYFCLTGHLRDLFMVLRFLLKASGNLLLKHLDVCCWKKSSGQMQTCYPHSCPSRSPTWERGLPSPTPGLLPGSLFSARMHRLDLHRLDSSPA